MTHNFLELHGPDNTPLYVRAESIDMVHNHKEPPIAVPIDTKVLGKVEWPSKSAVTFAGGTVYVRETVDEILHLLDRMGR